MSGEKDESVSSSGSGSSSTLGEDEAVAPILIDESYPDDYREYIRLLNESRGDAEALKQIRDTFSVEFPLLPTIWLQWIGDAIDAAVEGEDGDHVGAVAELFERALKDFHSDEVCARYILWASGVGMEFAKQVLERCAQAIGLRPDAAQIIWDSYLDIAEAEYATTSTAGDDAAKAKILSLFGRALRIPHANIRDLWQRCVEFVGGEENSVPSDLRSAYQSSLKAYRQLEPFEAAVEAAEGDDKEAAFSKYIAYETNGGQPARIQAIYERALLYFPFSTELWLQYVSWLDSAVKVPSVVIPAYDRACKLCAGCCALWQQSLLALERADTPYETMESVWENAKGAIHDEDEGVAVYRTYIYLTHRHIMKSGKIRTAELSLPVLYHHPSSEPPHQFKRVEKLFKEAICLLREQFGARRDSTIQLMKNYVYYLYSKSRRVEEARKVWSEILSTGCGNTAYAWLDAINMERHFGDVANTRRLLYMAVNSVTDRPYDVFNALVQFEREEGSLDALDKALEKVNAQARRIKARQPSTFDAFSSGGEASSAQPQKQQGRHAPPQAKKPWQQRKEPNERQRQSPPAPPASRKRPAPVPEEAMRQEEVGDDAECSQPKQARPDFQYGTGLEKNKLFVRNVDFACSEEELKDFFQTYGNVTAARIVTHKDGKPKGVAYVEFGSEADAAKALEADEKKLHNRKIRVFFSNPPAKSGIGGEGGEPRVPSLNPGWRGRGRGAQSFTPRVNRAGGISLLPRSISKANAEAPSNGKNQ